MGLGLGVCNNYNVCSSY